MESTGQDVIADFEAGIGTLLRMGPDAVDVVVIVVEPTPKSIEVGSRAAGLAREKGVERIVVIANRSRTDDDLVPVRAAFPDGEIIAVPDDPAIVAADREGIAPLDHDEDAPAVTALRRVADHLLDGTG